MCSRNDLPPIENLHISVIQKGMKKVGIVHAVVDKLVIVKALKDTQPLALDSVLFLSSGKPLGQVFDVFGPAVEPFYCIKFNSNDHIKNKGIIVDDDVFFAPDEVDANPHAFVEQIKLKGRATPCKDNNETLEKCLISSDDGEKAANGKQEVTKREIPIVSLKVLAKGTNGVSVYIPPSSTANIENNIVSTSPKPGHSTPISYAMNMQQNSFCNSYPNPLPNMSVPPPNFRPFLPNYHFVPPPCQLSSTLSPMPVMKNSFDVHFPPPLIPFPQSHPNMLHQQTALFPPSMINYQHPNIYGQIPGLRVSPPLQSPLISNPPISSSSSLLLPVSLMHYPNPHVNYFSQNVNSSFPSSPKPALKNLQWFQGQSLKK